MLPVLLFHPPVKRTSIEIIKQIEQSRTSRLSWPNGKPLATWSTLMSTRIEKSINQWLMIH